MTRIGRLLLLDRLTRYDGELTDRGQDVAEELYQRAWEEADGSIEEMGPGPVHPEARVY